MWVKALTNIRGVNKDEITKGTLFEIKDGELLRDCLESKSVERTARPQTGKSAPSRGTESASVEAVSILLRRLKVPEDRVEAMAGDIIAVVDSPATEAEIYANARADWWGEAAVAMAMSADDSESPLPVFPPSPDADEDIVSVKAED